MEALSTDIHVAFVFEIAGFFIAAFLSKVFSKTLRKPKPFTEKEQVEQLFRRCWRGFEEDRLYAWYRVKRHLLHTNAPVSQRTYVEAQIAACDRRPLVSRVQIDASGRLVSAEQLRGE
jgi:hypothetical protein